MNLRSGHQKPARKTSVEDDEEPVAEDPSDRASKTSHEAVDRGKIILENGVNRVSYKITTIRTKENSGERRILTDRLSSFGIIQHCDLGIALFVFVIIVSLLSQRIFSEYDKGHSGSDCRKALDELYQQYPQYETFWKEINVAYKICSNSDKPGVILLLHNGNGSVANCIVTRTAPLLSKLIGVNQMREYLIVDGRTAHQDYEVNSFLSFVLKERQRLGVVVFTYLEQMDSRLVKELHFICDSDSNIRDKAIIILVLKVESQTFENKNLEDLAKKQIHKLWKRKLDHRLQPIIGRITNVVASIDENVISKCP